MRGPGLTLGLLFGAVALVAGGLYVLTGGVDAPGDLRDGRQNGASVAGGGPDFAPPPDEGEVGGDDAETVDPASIPPEKAIRGVVRDRDGKQLASATVTALKTIPRRSNMETVARARTGEDGTFVLGPLEDRLTVEATAEGHARARKFARAGESVEFELGTPGILSGTVMYAGEGGPCANAFLKIWRHDGGAGGEITTDAGGTYRFADLPAGRYALSVMPDRSPTVHVRDIEVNEEEETTRDLVVVKGVPVTGRITDAQTSEPVAGAEVMIQGNERLTGESDEDGRYEVVGMGADRAQLQVRAKGYLQAYAQLMPRADGGGITCDVAMRRGGSVRGVVLGPGGELVSGAKIAENAWAFRNQNADFTTSGEDGTFLLEGVQPGKRTIFAKADGFAPGRSTTLDVQTGTETTGVEIRVTLGGSVAGKVTGPDGEPVAEATVNAWPTSRERMRTYPPDPAKTKDDGTYVIEHVPPGTYALAVILKGYQADQKTSVNVAEGSVAEGNDFVLRKGTFIEGKVLTADGKPIAEAMIHAWPTQRGFSGGWRPVNDKSKEDGTFRLEGLDEGVYNLNVTKSGFGQASETGVRTGTEGLEIRLKEQGALTGQILIGSTGKPAIGARVTLYRTHANGSWPYRAENVADPEGRFSLSGIGAGQYELEASTSAGLLSPREPVEIRAGEDPLPVTLRLGPGAAVSGLVQSPEGGPATGATVTATPQGPSGAAPAGQPVYSQTDAEGRFLLRPMRAGTYLLRAQHQQWTAATELITVSEGTELTVTLMLRRGGSIRVVVSGPDGSPLAGATVHLKDSAGQIQNPNWNLYRRDYAKARESNPNLDWNAFFRNIMVSDDAGVMTRRYLPPDAYTVTVAAGGHVPKSVSASVSDGRETLLSVTLESAEVAPGKEDAPRRPPPPPSPPRFR